MAACPTCRNLEFDNFEKELKPFYHSVYVGVRLQTRSEPYTCINPSFESLRKSHASGCETCGILIATADHVQEIREESWGTATFSADGLFLGYKHRDGPLTIARGDAGRGQFQLYISIEEPQTSENGGLFGREIDKDALSDRNLNLAKHWLQNCQTDHANCNRSNSDASLPTRVIAVGSATEEPRLHLSMGAKGSYAALSYSWGGEECIKLTKDTLDQRLESIPLDSLPPLFTQVITVLRHLSIPYLWIDSLCIIQDSRSDWLYEAARMKQVYANATLTIGAARSESDEPNRTGPSIGLTVNERRQYTSHYLGSTNQGTRKYYLRDYHLSQYDWPSHSRDISGGSLDSRAWTFQESALSKRMLYYGSKEMAWECASVIQCECTPTSVPRAAREKDLPLTPFSRAFHVNKRILSEPITALWDTWKELVRDYTSRALTVQSDRLIAIEGLAQRIASIIPSATYMAGIWKEDPSSLGWQRLETNPVPPGQKYPGPSWSWATLNSQVFFVLNKSTIYGLASMPVTPLLEITRWVPDEGLIEVYGLICEITLTEEDGQVYRPYPVDSVDTELWGETWPSIFRDFSVAPAKASAGMHYLLQAYDIGDTGTRGSFTYTAVVLQRSAQRSGCFERIGRFVSRQVDEETRRRQRESCMFQRKSVQII